ncbi:uncharacterized protein LOC134189387 [Corticium candelabrum]|uniref:uncharacterized protein LOC134189387 n=1 Tax=Corticium candelabrum TaxID=121492 RepID=UPI002E253825|nr:uncharacterized protein LOC134189387 [Corticium candelabrum]
MSSKIPDWVALWLVATSLICAYDATFVLLRPRTLEGGDLSFIFPGHVYYTTIDIKYGDMEDQFVIAQSILNLFEIILNVITLVMHCRSDWRAPVVAFLVQAFTFWKTVLYMIQYTPLCNGSHLVEHLDWLKYTALFLGTNGWWIVIPLLSLWTLWKTLLSAMAPSAGETDKTK